MSEPHGRGTSRGPRGLDVAGRPESGSVKPPEVLVVDDDRAVRRLVALVLERDGYLVVSANGGRDAIDLSARADFDLVLLDVNMLGTDGWTVLEALCERTPRPPALVMSGHADEAEALRRGAATLLRKPFSPAELLATMRGALRESAAGSFRSGGELDPAAFAGPGLRGAAAAGPLAA